MHTKLVTEHRKSERKAQCVDKQSHISKTEQEFNPNAQKAQCRFTYKTRSRQFRSFVQRVERSTRLCVNIKNLTEHISRSRNTPKPSMRCLMYTESFKQAKSGERGREVRKESAERKTRREGEVPAFVGFLFFPLSPGFPLCKMRTAMQLQTTNSDQSKTKILFAKKESHF